MPGPPIDLNTVAVGNLLLQQSGGLSGTVRLVTHIDTSASPFHTMHFADGNKLTWDTTTVGTIAIFTYEGTIL